MWLYWVTLNMSLKLILPVSYYFFNVGTRIFTMTCAVPVIFLLDSSGPEIKTSWPGIAEKDMELEYCKE